MAAALLPGALVGCAEGVDPSDDTDTGLDTEVDDTEPVDTEVDDTEAEGPPEVEFDALLLPEDDVTFGSAVAAGAMKPASALLATRVDWEQRIGVRVWQVVARPRVLLEVSTVVDVPAGGYVRVPVEGLQPGKVHEYAFFRLDSQEEPEARSAIGRFRTPPADSESPVLTLALCACNGGSTERTSAMGLVADHPEVDAIVHAGDMVYADGSEDLNDYRSMWSDWMTSEGYRASLAAAGIYGTWDDHEVDNNWDPEDVPQDQLAAAKQAWTETVPIELGDSGQVWRSYRWGSTAEILILDCRSERKASTRGTTDEYLSRAQMDWLKGRLKDSPCRFKVVLNSVPITNMPGVWDFAKDDRWEGYPKQRVELFDWIDTHDIADVWFLSGDFHVCFVGRVQGTRPGRSGKLWEIAATSGNVNPLGAALSAPQFRVGLAEARLVTVSFDPATGDVGIKLFEPGTGTLQRELTLNQEA